MEILAFKIRGKLAHFRKYYANNTAMSFTIPPRTTIMGIIAGSMGWPRGSYHEDLASENVQIGISVLSSLKKSFHRLNLLSIKSTGDLSKQLSSDFRGEGGRIQTPFEVVSAWDIGRGEVAYHVFLLPTKAGMGVFNTIKDHFLNRHPVFNTTLGTANFTARIDAVELISKNIEEIASADYALIHSAIPTKLIEKLAFESKSPDLYNFIEEDMMPGDFVANGNREVRQMNRLLFSTTPKPLKVKLNSAYYHLNLEAESINIQFVDS